MVLSLSLIALPTSAWAVGVSSAHGSGNQSRTVSYGNGAQVSGSLTSLQGYPVYYEGRVDTGGFGCSDATIGRYSSNVTSSGTRGGTISTFLGSCSFDGVRSRISRDIPNAPDPSGNWSSLY